MTRVPRADSIPVTDGSPADVGTDLRLLEALHQGSEEAFAMLVHEHGPSVERTVRRLLGYDDRHIEDVVQDTLLAAWHGRRHLRTADAAGAWLRGIAVRRCRSHVARQVRRRRLARFLTLGAAAPVAAPATTDPAVDAAAREVDPELARAFGTVSHTHREILTLVHLEGLTVPEAARALGINAGAATARLHRARRALEDQLPGGVARDKREVAE